MKAANYTFDNKNNKPEKCSKSNFNVDDWVVDDCDYIWKIKGILNQYILEGVEGDESCPTIEWVNKTFHRWTIDDAKPGDVLSNGDMILIFKQFETPAYKQHVIAYIGLDMLGNIQVTDGTWNLGIDKVKPATKEQRELLFKKMKAAGYTWDDEKKELTHVQVTKQREQDNKWTADDEENMNILIGCVEQLKVRDIKYDDLMKRYKNVISWLEEIKERLK
jgi:hypothetical protein